MHMKPNKGLFGLILFVVLLSQPGTAQIPFYPSRRAAVRDQGMGLLAKSPTRSIIDLNGSWHYRLIDEEGWNLIGVPSSYASEQRLLLTREFTVDPDLLQKSVFQLVAVSISYYCEIKINDQFIGKHAGLTSMSLKLTPGVLKPGSNRITVEVHNILNAQETVPLREQLRSPRNYGGIIGDIALVAYSSVWVQETTTKSTITGEGKAATLQYQALLNSGAAAAFAGDSVKASALGKRPVDHMIEIVDASTGEVVARSDVRRIEIEPDRLVPVDITVTVPSVHLWSPESPYLYTIHQKTYHNSVLLDESYTQIGFRQFGIRGTSFTLNGLPYVLKGLTYIEDSPRHGRSLSMEEYERDILLLKNLGANTIRLPYGASHPSLLNLCDRYGLLVLYDIPIQRTPASILRRQSFISSAKNILKESVSRDNNHPSVVAWGFGGSLDGLSGDVTVLFQELKKLLRATAHMAYASFETPVSDLDPELIDFQSCDLYRATRESVQQRIEQTMAIAPEKPLLISSVCYPVEIGNYNGYSDPRSIDAQAQFFLEIYNLVSGKQLAGIIVHTFADYAVSSPLMSTDRIHQFTGTFGVVDAFRLKRLAYDVLKSRFNNEKPPVLVVGNFVEEHPSTFVIVGLLIIFLFAIVYNLFRRFRENVVRSFLRPHNFFTDVRDQRMLSIFQTSMVGILGTFSSALIAANAMYYWKTNVFFDVAMFQFFPTPWVKQWVNFAAWNPLANIVVFAVGFFVVLTVFALFLRAVAFFLKRNVLLFDAYSVSMWSVLPVIMLAPLGMILYRIMDLAPFEVAALILLLVFVVWIISRLLKGTAVVLDLRPLYFYIGGYTVLLIGLGVWFYTLNEQTGLFGYLRYFFNVWSYNGSLHS
jgi:beta-galactosidase